MKAHTPNKLLNLLKKRKPNRKTETEKTDYTKGTKIGMI